ncbi:MAG: prenyltransferase [Clostridiales bacterium]|nr:prenyltransferase [Clostridiales bacterium]
MQQSKSNLYALKLVPSEFAGCIRRKGFRRLTLRAVIELAAPQTWGASVMPVVVAAALAIAADHRFSFPLFFSLLGTSVCLQCAVNTLNDYSDFIAGVDKRDNCLDETDASILYHDYEPVLAFVIGGGFILLALLCGLYALFTVGPQLLIFGAVGAAVVFAYSYGFVPLSYTPVGELLSGLVMGGVIPVACFYAFTGRLTPFALLASVPLILTIGLIMLTNNACDIEKDIASERHTLPTRFGRTVTKRLHGALFAVALAVAAALSIVRFGLVNLWMAPLLCLWLIPMETALLGTDFAPERRVRAMSLSTGANIRLNTVYAVMILLPSVLYGGIRIQSNLGF